MEENSPTEKGNLGIGAKVSTVMTARRYEKRVVCIYTKDHRDYSDMFLILDGLRKLGHTGRIPYKTDVATLQGRYGTDDEYFLVAWC